MLLAHWVTLVAVCVGEVGGVSWLKMLFLFARGDGGGVLCLFSVFGFAVYPSGMRWVVWCDGLLERSVLSVSQGIL